MITVKKCCCCISLKKGTITIGALELITAFCSLSVTYVGSKWFSKNVLLIFEALSAAHLITWIVVSSLLIAGTVRDKPRFVFAYLVIIIILLLISIVWNTAIIVYSFVKKAVSDGVTLSVLLGIEIAIQAYLWIVVYSFYKSMK